MSAETIAQTLGRWVTGLKYEDLTPEAVYAAKRCMLDTLGVELRGANLPWVQAVYRGLRASGGNEAAIAYYGDRVSAPYAAYVNSAFAYSCELQHHGPLGSAHVGVVVGPAVQALGEQLGCSGKEIITAMVAGYEVQGRLGIPLFDAMSKHHFHPQGVLGVFGAAAAAGKLLGLTAEQQAHAFAIAGSHASTVLEYDQSGGEVKRIHGAIAARSGMQSAILAKEGLTGPLTIFEGRRGIFAAFAGGDADPSQVLPGLGKPYCITRCRFRIYPTIGSCHAVLDIVNDMLAAQPFDYRDVQGIKIGLWEFSVMHATTIKRPHDVISAQACLGFSLGLRLVKGGNDLEMYMDPKLWSDPEVLSIADKMEAYTLVVPGHPQSSRVEITLKNGQVLRGEMADARGTEDLPFTQEVIEAKFRRLAGAMLPADQVNQIVQIVSRLEELPTLSALTPLLRKP